MEELGEAEERRGVLGALFEGWGISRAVAEKQGWRVIGWRGCFPEKRPWTTIPMSIYDTALLSGGCSFII